MKIDIDTATQVFYVVLAAAGGMARYLYSYIETGHFQFGMFLAHAALSMFSGYMFAQFGIFIGVKETGLFLFAGMGGFMGTKALEIIQANYLRTTVSMSKKKPKKTETETKVDPTSFGG